MFFVGTLLVLLVVAAIGSYAYASSNAGRILSGVNIGGVPVAGLTPDQAKAKLLSTLPDVAQGSLTVKAGSVDPDDPVLGPPPLLQPGPVD